MAENHDMEMEKLSRAIVEAILNSKDVKTAMEKIQKIEDVDAKTLMVFVLKLDSLNQIKGTEFSDFADLQDLDDDMADEEELGKLRKKKVRRKIEKPEIVDGRVVSRSEKKFLEYLSENFDSESWLKKHRISLD